MWLRFAQWTGMSPKQREKLDEYQQLTTPQKEQAIQETHRHSPDMMDFLRIALNIDSEYVRRIAIPSFPAKILRDIFAAYTVVEESFQEFMKHCSETYQSQGSFSTQQLNTLNDMCLYASVFGKSAPDIIRKLTSKKLSPHIIAGSIRSVTGAQILGEEDPLFNKFFDRIIKFKSQNFQEALSAYPIIKDEIENVQSMEEITLEFVAAAALKNKELIDNLAQSDDPLFKLFCSYAKKYDMPVGEIADNFADYVNALKQRANQDEMPTFTFSIPLSEFDKELDPNRIAVFKRLHWTDPRALFLGFAALYDCCFRIEDGAAARSSVLYSIASPKAANYEVITCNADGTGPQCAGITFAWKDTNGAICFDNIEGNKSQTTKMNYLTASMFQRAADIMVREHNVPCVTCGTGYGEEDITPGKPPWKSPSQSDHRFLEILYRTRTVSHYDLLELGIKRYEDENINPFFYVPQTISLVPLTPPGNIYTDADEYQRFLAGQLPEAIMPRTAVGLLPKIIQCLEQEQLTEEQKQILIDKIPELIYAAKNEAPSEPDTDLFEDDLNESYFKYITESRAWEIATERAQEKADEEAQDEFYNMTPDEFVERFEAEFEIFVERRNDEISRRNEDLDDEDFEEDFVSEDDPYVRKEFKEYILADRDIIPNEIYDMRQHAIDDHIAIETIIDEMREEYIIGSEAMHIGLPIKQKRFLVTLIKNFSDKQIETLSQYLTSYEFLSEFQTSHEFDPEEINLIENAIMKEIAHKKDIGTSFLNRICDFFRKMHTKLSPRITEKLLLAIGKSAVIRFGYDVISMPFEEMIPTIQTEEPVTELEILDYFKLNPFNDDFEQQLVQRYPNVSPAEASVLRNEVIRSVIRDHRWRKFYSNSIISQIARDHFGIDLDDYVLSRDLAPTTYTSPEEESYMNQPYTIMKLLFEAFKGQPLDRIMPRIVERYGMQKMDEIVATRKDPLWNNINAEDDYQFDRFIDSLIENYENYKNQLSKENNAEDTTQAMTISWLKLAMQFKEVE